MHATTRRLAGLSRQQAPESTPLSVDETRSPSISIAEDSYGKDRRKRLRRARLVGFALCIPLWVLSVVPLAREFTDGREAAALVLVFLAVAAFSLAAAVALRWVYVLLTGRRFWSPWLFPLAALVAIVGYTVQSAGEEDVSFESALGGVVRNVADNRPGSPRG
jgi:hypothetical protein